MWRAASTAKGLLLAAVLWAATPATWAGEPQPESGTGAPVAQPTDAPSPGADGGDAPAADGGAATEPADKPKPPPPRVTGPPPGASKAQVIAWEAGNLVDEGALKAAEAKANLAISVDSDEGAGHYQLARIRVREGRVIEAYQTLKQAVSKDPIHAPSHMLLMRVSLMGGQSPTAEVLALDGIVANNPDNLRLKMALAEGYLATDQFNLAIKEARKVLKKAETSVGAMKLLARAYLASKRVAASEAILRRTRDIRKDPEASFLLARIRMQQKRLVSARDLLEEAVKLKPDYVEALNNLGMVYIKVRNYGAAQDALTKAVTLAPAFAAAFLNLGAAQRGAKRFQAAEQSWKKVLALKPDMADANYNLGILYLENKLPGRDRIKQLTEAVKRFTAYKSSSQEAAADKNVDKYLGEANLLIKQEKQRRKEQLKMLKEKKKLEEKKADPPADDTTPPVDGATPPADGATPPADGAQPPAEKTGDGGQGGGG